MESLGPIAIVSFFLSLFLGLACFFYMIKSLIIKKVAIKVIAESLEKEANNKSVIILVSSILFILGISFFAICVSLILSTYINIDL